MQISRPSRPVVSIVIPAFNSARFLRRCVSSILRQSITEFEIIVVDDASADDTAQVIASFVDPRIRYIRQPVNAGAPAARNRGLEIAEGDWVAWVDADDWLTTSRIENLLRAGEESGAEMVADNVYWAKSTWRSWDDDGRVVLEDGTTEKAVRLFRPEVRKRLPGYVSAAYFIYGNAPGPHALNLGLMQPMFKRSFLERNHLRWPVEVRHSQDTAFYLACMRAGARLYVVPDAGYYYRKNMSGISQSASALNAGEHRLEVNRRMMSDASDDIFLRVALRYRAVMLRRSIGYERVRSHERGLSLVEPTLLDRVMHWWYEMERLGRQLPGRVSGRIMRLMGL